MTCQTKFSKPLPQYQCIKVVGALKIKEVRTVTRARFHTFWELHFEEDGYEPQLVTEGWYNNHHPAVGGYLVQYSNDYLSYSPNKEFVEGYFLIDPNASLIEFPKIPLLERAGEWIRQAVQRAKGPNI